MSDDLVDSLNAHSSHFSYGGSLLFLSQQEKENLEIITLQEDTPAADYEEKKIPFLSKSLDWAISDDEIGLSIMMNFPKQCYEKNSSYLIENKTTMQAYLVQDDIDDEEWEDEEEGEDEEETEI